MIESCVSNKGRSLSDGPGGGLRWAQMEFNAEGEEIEIVPNFAQPEADLQFIEVRVNTSDQLHQPASSHASSVCS